MSIYFLPEAKEIPVDPVLLRLLSDYKEKHKTNISLSELVRKIDERNGVIVERIIGERGDFTFYLDNDDDPVKWSWNIGGRIWENKNQ